MLQNYWKSATSAIANLNENISHALEGLDKDMDTAATSSADLESNLDHGGQEEVEELEMYKKLLEDAQMQHVQLSKQLGNIIASKDAEIASLKANDNHPVRNDIKGNETAQGDVYLLVQEKIALEKALEDFELRYQEVLRSSNEGKIISSKYETLLRKYKELELNHLDLRHQTESLLKQKTDEIDNLVLEYSKLAADTELRIVNEEKQVQLIKIENEVFQTKIQALEHSISEFADRATNTNTKNQSSYDNLNNDKIQNENKELRGKLVNLQYDIKERDDMINSLRTQLQDSLANQSNIPQSFPATNISEEAYVTLEKQLNELTMKNSNLTIDIERLIVEKRESEEAGKKFFEDNRNYKKEIEQLKTQVTTLTNQIQTLHQELSNKDTTIDRLQSDLTHSANSTNDNNSTIISELQKQMKSIELELFNTKQTSIEEKSKFESQKNQLEIELKSLESQYLSSTLEIKTLHEVIESKEKSFKELKETMDLQLNMNTDHYQTIIKQNESIIEDLNNQIKQILDDKKSLELQIDSLKNLESAFKSQSSTAIEELESVYNQNTNNLLQKMKQNEENILNEHRVIIEKLTQEHNKQCETLQTLNHQLQATNEELKQTLNQTIESYQRELNDNMLKLKETERLYDVLKETLESEKQNNLNTIKLFEKQIEDCKNDYNNQLIQKENESNKLLNIQSELERDIESLRQQCVNYRTTITNLEQTMQSNMTTSQNEINSLQDQLNQKINELQEYKQFVDNKLQQKDKEFNDSMETLRMDLTRTYQQREEVLINNHMNDKAAAIRNIEETAAITLSQELSNLTNLHEIKLRQSLDELSQLKAKELESTIDFISKEAERKRLNDLHEADKISTMKLEAMRSELEEKIAILQIATQKAKEDLLTVEKRYEVKMADALAALENQKEIEKSQALAVLKSSMQKLIDEANNEKEEYLALYTKENKLRKAIHNKLLEIQGNIRVICRVRPILEVERKSGEDIDVTSFPSLEDITIQRDSHTRTRYEYDRVFNPTSSQSEVFEAVQPMVVSVLDGYNVCIFAYGQTGSGKTYTMEGSPTDSGISPRAISELFRLIQSMEETWTFTLSFSMLEIYNESILDLLDSNPNKEKLDIRQTPEGNTVPGLTEIIIFNPEQVKELMSQGQANRAVGSHDMNEHSSRSHSILTVVCRGKNKVDGTVTFGKLNLIDLAGSERVSKTDATGDRLKEAQNINRSLFALGDVINALSNKKNTHVPYRNSKLTFLLQDSLGGNSKVLMVVNISPAIYNLGETICSLNFASKCRNTELGQASKKVIQNDDSSVASTGSGSTTISSSSTTGPSTASAKLLSPSIKRNESSSSMNTSTSATRRVSTLPSSSSTTSRK